jgi:uncharacterized protein (TIGR03437 family)
MKLPPTRTTSAIPAFLLFSASFLPLRGGAQTPMITNGSVANGVTYIAGGLVPGSWAQVKGTGLATVSRLWSDSDFSGLGNGLPMSLSGTSVKVNGQSAALYFVDPGQVNFQVPSGISGTATVQVFVNGVGSNRVTAGAASNAPGIVPIIVNGVNYAGGVFLDGKYVGDPSIGSSFRKAKPGDAIQLYATGLVVSPAGVRVSFQPVSGVTVTIGNITVPADAAGLVGPGEFQVNFTVPPQFANLPEANYPITIAAAGVASPAAINTVPAAPIVVPIQPGPVSPSVVTFYVAPNGSDSWSGTLAAPNTANTDGPFASLDRARVAIQALAKAPLKQVSVQLRGGTYFLPATVQFSAVDSGSPSMKIIYENYPGETPVISGGVRVQNWTSIGGNIWKAALSASTQYFENLFYNGVRRLRPRLGGSLGTYYRIVGAVYLNAPGPPAKAPEANCSSYVTGSGWECFDRFQFDPADPIAGTWKNLAPPSGNPCAQPPGNPSLAGDIEVLDFEQFVASKLRLSCVDTARHLVYLTGPTVQASGRNGFIPGHRYLVENVQDALTQPGQWFLDRSTNPWTLTYLAAPGENPNSDTVVIPQLTQVLTATNLQYVTFQGLTFAHDNFIVPVSGYASQELDTSISAAVSFQNSQQITFDSNIVTQTSGAGLEILSCTDSQSPAWCLANSVSGVSSQVTVQNSGFYDLGASGLRIGEGAKSSDSDASVPQLLTVANNVVEGYGRTFPSVFGIAQGVGHDNTYTHNDVYDGYHVAISICHCAGDTFKPNGGGAFNNTISFNHVYKLEQGIMNDGGSIRIGTGNSVFTAAGNKILNNKVHDVSDASALDADGYGGNGIYLDNQTGLVDVENNLVYRVSGNAVNLPQGPPVPNEANTIRNNILAFARQSLINDNNPYPSGSVPTVAALAFVATNNLFYFDRTAASSPAFYTQGGCTYSGGFAYTAFQQWNNNLYWRTDGGFAADPQAFHVQPNAGPTQLCVGNTAKWTFYPFSQWQQKAGEDLQSVVQNPGFANPAYPADDYSLPKGSPLAGFIVFDPNQAGRSNPVISPPAVAATYPTKPFNPETDY